MARPSSSFRLAALAAASLLLTSCLELTVTLNFRTATSGTVTVEAVADRAARGLTWEEVALPTTRSGWQNVVDSVPSENNVRVASLTSWEGSEDDAGFRSRTVLAFSSSRALESLFVSFKQKLTLLQDVQGKYNLVFAPGIPRLATAAADTRKLWIDLWGDRAWKFVVAPPAVAPTVFTATLRDLAAEKAPADWRLSW